jgi:AAA+ ATPase superfamily predicted ATPase
VVEAQFLSKLLTNNVNILLKLIFEGHTNEAQVLNVTVSYCPRPPIDYLEEIPAASMVYCIPHIFDCLKF